jgi:hypothetical protein
MGVVDSINPLRGRFPKQSEYVDARTVVVFHYDTTRRVGGTIVRDDAEAPFVTIIQIDDGPLVLGTECQYTPPMHMVTGTPARLATTGRMGEKP